MNDISIARTEGMCVGAAVMFIIMGLTFSFMYGMLKMDHVTLKQEAVQLNYAGYNPTNGVWQWKH